MFTDLPFDILDGLAARYLSVSEMRNCSLACRKLHEMLQSRLFRRVWIAYAPSEAQPFRAQTNRVISDFPAISKLIHRLTIQRNAVENARPELAEAIVGKLPAMESLTTLVLTGEGLAFQDFKVPNLVISAITLQYHLFSTVRSLVLHSLTPTLSLKLLSSFPNIESLTLMGLSLLEEDASEIAKAPDHRPSIKRLTVGLENSQLDRFIRWACDKERCPVDFDQLKTLRLSSGYRDTALTHFRDDFVEMYGAHVETLDLHLFGWSEYWANFPFIAPYFFSSGNGRSNTTTERGAIDLSNLSAKLPNLRTLRIQTEATGVLSIVSSAYSTWLPTTLSHFQSSTSPHLSKIALYFSVTKDALLEPLNNQTDTAALDLDKIWQRADHSLATLPLSSLSAYLTAPEDDVEQVIPLLSKRLPTLHSESSRTEIRVSKPPLPSEYWTRSILIRRKAQEMD